MAGTWFWPIDQQRLYRLEISEDDEIEGNRLNLYQNSTSNIVSFAYELSIAEDYFGFHYNNKKREPSPIVFIPNLITKIFETWSHYMYTRF